MFFSNSILISIPFYMSKRKQPIRPRRELPWIGPLVETLPFSRLPTNNTILQRLHFEISASCNGNSSLDSAAITVKNELVELWGYAGYADILQQSSWIVHKIKLLNKSILTSNPSPRYLSPAALLLPSWRKKLDSLQPFPNSSTSQSSPSVIVSSSRQKTETSF